MNDALIEAVSLHCRNLVESGKAPLILKEQGLLAMCWNHINSFAESDSTDDLLEVVSYAMFALSLRTDDVMKMLPHPIEDNSAKFDEEVADLITADFDADTDSMIEIVDDLTRAEDG